MFSRGRIRGVAVALGVLALAAPVAAQQSKNGKDAATSPSATATTAQSYDALYQKYLDEARRTPTPASGWIANLMSDPRAHRTNDLVTVNVVESLSASGTADANTAKTTKSSVSLPPSPIATGINKVLPAATDNEFKGSGETSRNTTMTATMTARVTETLPNGDLVVEGVREILINDERQLVVLTGVVRQADINSLNVVSSNAVGQLRIQCIGKGLMKDSLSPGWLVRALNKVF